MPNNTTTDSIAIFVHGFTGSSQTWGEFPDLLANDSGLGYTFEFWEYPTTLNPAYAITKYFWTDDPNIETIGQALRTKLAHAARGAQKIVLVGHSMGGLAIQAFILEEVGKGRREYLDRLVEVILCGTPSGGLAKASWFDFLKNQIADMGLHGPFIEKLRSGWKLLIDDRRADPARLTQFRLTLVAGMKDRFVPPESALRPFPFDDQCWVPGDHVALVKPKSREDLIYTIVRDRLTRPALTAAERGLINGESETAVAFMNRVRAAAGLDDTETLLDLADALKHNAVRLPRVERELGLALLETQAYPLAVEMLQRYLAFQMPDRQQPFNSDAQAIQQLAIALSGTGDIVGAVTQLKALEPQVQNDPETQGILAGRFKRQWLKNPTTVQIGWRALQLYKSAFEMALSQGDSDQIIYNGINAAYMNFALGATDYTILADEVLAACQTRTPADYWTDATRAEAYLLLRRYAEADQAYGDALRHAPSPRWWSTTGQQAIDLIKRQGNPSEASDILARFASIKLDI